MWAQLYPIFFLPVYSRLSWLWRVSSKYLFLLSCHLSTVSIQDCVKIRTIFLERAVVAIKKAEYIILYLLKYLICYHFKHGLAFNIRLK